MMIGFSINSIMCSILVYQFSANNFAQRKSMAIFHITTPDFPRNPQKGKCCQPHKQIPQSVTRQKRTFRSFSKRIKQFGKVGCNFCCDSITLIYSLVLMVAFYLLALFPLQGSFVL